MARFVTTKDVEAIYQAARQRYLDEGASPTMATRRAKKAIDEFKLLAKRLQGVQHTAPYLLFDPYDGWQKKFWASQAYIRLAHCGNQVGKSYIVAADAVWQMYKAHPHRKTHINDKKFSVRIVGVDVDHTIHHWMDTILPAMLPAEELGHYNKVTKRLSIHGLRPNPDVDSHYFEFMTHGMDVNQFASVQRTITIFDEVPPRAIWHECELRTREIMIAATPALEGGETVFFRELVERLKEWPHTDEEAIEMGRPGDPTAELFCGSRYEAARAGVTTYTVADVEAQERNMPEDQARCRIHGELVNVGGLVFKNYRDAMYPNGHLFDPTEMWEGDAKTLPGIPPMEGWQIIASLDPSINGVTTCLWGAVNKKHELYIFDEYYDSEKVIPQHAASIKEKEARHGRIPFWRCIDPASAQKQPSLKEQAQVPTLEQYIDCMDDDAGFEPAGRDEAGRIEMVKQMLHFAGEDGEDGPRLFIGENCRNLRREIINLSWQRFVKPEEHNPKQKVADFKNHTTDALGYMCVHGGGIEYYHGADQNANFVWQNVGDMGGRYIERQTA